MVDSTKELLNQINACTYCKDLPLGPRPVVRFSSSCKLLIVGQAPGTAVHKSGIPWDDPSGERLRTWMNIDKESFYDDSLIAIMPMGFCYPGKGKSGDLPPRPECASLWHDKILEKLENIELTLLIGQYAQAYFLGDKRKKNLTETVKSWNDYTPKFLPLPHPSPRNNIWLKKNQWFEKDVVPYLSDICSRFF